MPERSGDVADAARRIADALEASGIEYAIGGALAYAYYGVPRATNDIDLNVFPSAFAFPELVAALEDAGCEIDASRALQALSTGNDFGAKCMGWRVDVFPPTLALHDSARERVVVHPLLGRPARFLSAEDLMLFKVLYHRAIDLVDLERLLAVQGPKLDFAYVRRWLEKLLPVDDPRLAEIETMLRRVVPNAAH
jgi:hypothetical protein